MDSPSDSISILSSPSKRKKLSSCCTNTNVPLGHTLEKPLLLFLSSRMDDLTDDVLLEIFLRLPAKTLHRVKCISKRWLALISAPCFARSHLRVHPFNNKKILFFNINTHGNGQAFGLPLLDDNDNTNNVSSSILSGSFPPLSFDFIPALRDYNDRSKGENEKLLLVDTRVKHNSTGFLLLEACYQDKSTTATNPTIPYVDYNSRYFIYYVCNPVTKDWVKLPLISSTRDLVGFTCYYLHQQQGEMTRIWANNATDNVKESAYYDPNKLEYTVVLINKDEDVQDDVFIIRIFSSTEETSEWTSFRVPIPQGYKWEETFIAQRVLFSNGKFHWHDKNNIIAYDPFNKPNECDIIPLPPMNSRKCARTTLFATYEGRIRVGTPFWTGVCSIWELDDHATRMWVNKYDVNIKDHRQTLSEFQTFVGGAREKAYVLTRQRTYYDTYGYEKCIPATCLYISYQLLRSVHVVS